MTSINQSESSRPWMKIRPTGTKMRTILTGKRGKVFLPLFFSFAFSIFYFSGFFPVFIFIFSFFHFLLFSFFPFYYYSFFLCFHLAFLTFLPPTPRPPPPLTDWGEEEDWEEEDLVEEDDAADKDTEVQSPFSSPVPPSVPPPPWCPSISSACLCVLRLSINPVC
jgi:hypothetical protein